MILEAWVSDSTVSLAWESGWRHGTLGSETPQ